MLTIAERTPMVRFAEVLNVTIDFSTQGYVKKDLWYSREDFLIWKQRSREMSHAWRLQGFSVLLDHVVSEPAESTLEKLAAVALLDRDHCFRGVERYLNEEHDEERNALQIEAIEAVLECQRRLKLCRPEQRSSEIGRVYQEKSLKARIFARCQGQADEMAAREGDDPLRARRLVSEASSGMSLTRWDSWSSNASGAPQQPRRSLPTDVVKGSIDNAGQIEQGSEFSSVKCPFSPASPSDELLETSPHLLHLGPPGVNGGT